MNKIKFKKNNQFDPEVGDMFSETMGPISTLSQLTRPQSEHRTHYNQTTYNVSCLQWYADKCEKSHAFIY